MEPKKLASALRERANDHATLEHHSGPRSINAVRVALLHFADILDGEKKMVHKKPEVRKRTPDAP